MGRLQVTIGLIALWCALTVHAAGVVLAPPIEQESSSTPPGVPLTEEQIICLFAALDAGLDPNLECEL
jgi:hypothetical protein